RVACAFRSRAGQILAAHLEDKSRQSLLNPNIEGRQTAEVAPARAAVKAVQTATRPRRAPVPIGRSVKPAGHNHNPICLTKLTRKGHATAPERKNLRSGALISLGKGRAATTPNCA